MSDSSVDVPTEEADRDAIRAVLREHPVRLAVLFGSTTSGSLRNCGIETAIVIFWSSSETSLDEEGAL